jgi:hypothetical protein
VALGFGDAVTDAGADCDGETEPGAGSVCW